MLSHPEPDTDDSLSRSECYKSIMPTSLPASDAAGGNHRPISGHRGRTWDAPPGEARAPSGGRRLSIRRKIGGGGGSFILIPEPPYQTPGQRERETQRGSSVASGEFLHIPALGVPSVQRSPRPPQGSPMGSDVRVSLFLSWSFPQPPLLSPPLYLDLGHLYQSLLGAGRKWAQTPGTEVDLLLQTLGRALSGQL